MALIVEMLHHDIPLQSYPIRKSLKFEKSHHRLHIVHRLPYANLRDIENSRQKSHS